MCPRTLFEVPLKKKDEIEFEEVDLGEVVRDTVEIVGPEALKKGIELDTDASGSLSVRGDRVHLEQVILNLAMNGIDAMQDCAPGHRKLSIKATPIDNFAVEVSVADTGMGISPDGLKKIFDPFYTTKSQGTGLGLSIARTIVETYGGKIHAENRPEGGALVCFTMPLSKSKPTRT